MTIFIASSEVDEALPLLRTRKHALLEAAEDAIAVRATRS
jgi:hypothetical protein